MTGTKHQQLGGYSLEQAVETAEALTTAMDSISVRPTHFKLKNMAEEWARVSLDFQASQVDDDVDCIVDFAGNLQNGMLLYKHDLGAVKISRILRKNNGEEWGIQVSTTHRNQQAYFDRGMDSMWTNVLGADSPVCVVA